MAVIHAVFQWQTRLCRYRCNSRQEEQERTEYGLSNEELLVPNIKELLGIEKKRILESAKRNIRKSRGRKQQVLPFETD